jgi:hypothetical protein
MVYLCSSLDEMNSGIMWVFDRLIVLVEYLFYFNLNAGTVFVYSKLYNSVEFIFNNLVQ